MQKYLKSIVLVLGIVVMMIPGGRQKVSAQADGYLATTIGFTLDPNQPGQLLQSGSVIDELSSGVTQVYGPDGTLVLSILDSQSAAAVESKENILTDHAFTVPDGSNVVNTGKEIDIYSQNNLILTIIYQKDLQSAISTGETPNVIQSSISAGINQNVKQPTLATNA